MPDDHARDELAQLRAQVATFQARMDRPRRRLPRRFLPLALVALLVALLPLATVAAGFTDLNLGSPHNDNIVAIAAAGITKGCNPPDNTQYCPTRNVTREEMASFLARTAGLGANPPVANAKTAQTATNATTAQNLQGYAPNGLVRVFGAANGTNSTGGEVNVPGGSTGTTIITIPFTAPAAGYVALTASVAVIAPGTGCPCYVGYYSQSDTTPITSPVMADTLANSGRATGAVTWTFPVVAGVNTFSIVVYRIDASAAVVQARPAVTGIYTPFGATGATP